MSANQSQRQGQSRAARKAETRARIRAAAAERFGELGYGGAGIGDIARAAGVAHGTFYVHYASKDAVLDELLAEFNERLAATLRPVVAAAAGRPLREVIGAMAEGFLAHWEGHRGLVTCLAERAAGGVSPEDLREGVNPPMVALVRAALAGAAGPDGPPPGVDLELATHGLLGLWLPVGLRVGLDAATERAAAVRTLTKLTSGAVEALLSTPNAEGSR